jgi:thioredoxin 2
MGPVAPSASVGRASAPENPRSRRDDVDGGQLGWGPRVHGTWPAFAAATVIHGGGIEEVAELMDEASKVEDPTVTVVTCTSCGTKNRVPAAAPGFARCGHCHSPLPWIAEADDATFRAVVEDADLPVLVDLWAPWCGPCRTVSPALESLAGELAGRVKLVKVDVDGSPAVSKQFAVQGIPTLLLVDHGRVVDRQTGAAPLPALRSWLEQALASA